MNKLEFVFDTVVLQEYLGVDAHTLSSLIVSWCMTKNTVFAGAMSKITAQYGSPVVALSAEIDQDVMVRSYPVLEQFFNQLTGGKQIVNPQYHHLGGVQHRARIVIDEVSVNTAAVSPTPVFTMGFNNALF